ncbi:MAG: right-handed parallel beta-helix repeat-containing protein [Phycisphaerales bacterium]|nr:right-handed parallel beta-helix repeat-containing protein [Phycisphaerales bacterium]
MNASCCRGGAAALFMFLAAGSCIAVGPPTVVVDRDNVEITQNCFIRIGATPIPDADGNGVIHVKASGITIEFLGDEEAREMMGAPDGTPWDAITGIGIMIDGQRDVTIRNAHCHRYKVGIYARHADGLTLENCDVAGGFATRLRSTPAAEDGSDWLFPHHNDNHEWVNNFGAGICVENSERITISGCFARRRQNGIIIDRVNNSRLYDNDCSFLSGWGLAMWRSSRNVITRNAFDFCVRGYSHMVYNRGQDSAGILMFEQCSDNIIAETSATHGGDGFFGFAGREALGEAPPREGMSQAELQEFCKARGNNNNLLINNDFSYAPAHGIEMTFSFTNRFIGNRLVENAICGIWGGYSQSTLIADNTFTNNGEMAYGLERGGVNIEHGFANQIISNRFERNKCGVHLWTDPDEGLVNSAWGKANDAAGSSNNSITSNSFNGDVLAIQLRECENTHAARNTFTNVGKEIELTDSSEPGAPLFISSFDGGPDYPVFGKTRPVGARPELRGRANIIMTEWGPWDHAAPMVRLRSSGSSGDVYDVFGAAEPMRLGAAPAGFDVQVEETGEGRYAVSVTPREPGIASYSIPLRIGGEFETTIAGTIIRTSWDITFFKWERDATDPRNDLEAWRRLAGGPTAVHLEADSLTLPFAMGGPKDVRGLGKNEALGALGSDLFGTIARARVPLSAGTWRLTTRSDDGVRITVNGPGVKDQRVIDNWTWHAPTVDQGEFTLSQAGEVHLLVEHFEIDGYAVLELSIEKVR